jgi:tagatose-6-phosphate ketose/aldose isomerase
VLPYEKDLLLELSSGTKPLYMAGLIESGSLYGRLDELFVLSDSDIQLDEDFLPVCFILPAQMLGFYKSLQLGLDPDMPSKSGTISRIVKGVVIYPFNNHK